MICKWWTNHAFKIMWMHSVRCTVIWCNACACVFSSSKFSIFQVDANALKWNIHTFSCSRETYLPTAMKREVWRHASLVLIFRRISTTLGHKVKSMGKYRQIEACKRTRLKGTWNLHIAPECMWFSGFSWCVIEGSFESKVKIQFQIDMSRMWGHQTFIWQSSFVSSGRNQCTFSYFSLSKNIFILLTALPHSLCVNG